jgi:serine/threonine-protein kinase
VGRASDARSDVYSLGCLLYAMLTGGPPFSGDVSAAVLHQQVNADPPAPSRLRHEVPAGLDVLVLAMLAKAPEARPATAERVRDRLLALSAAGVGPTAAVPRVEASGRARPGAAAGAAATRPTRPGRAPPAVAAALADHRRRSIVMGLATALIALAALALLSGGGSSATRAANHTRARVSTHHAATHQAATQPAASTPPAHTSPKTPPKPAGPSDGRATPPGHGGEPPGQVKKHGGGGDSGGPGHGHGGPGGGPGGGDGGGQGNGNGGD